MKHCVFIATPTRDMRVGASYATSLLHTYRHLQSRSIDMHVDMISGGGIVQSRNRAVAAFMRDTDATHLLFLDDDHTWLPESVTHLMTAIELGSHCVGAAYPQRSIDWDLLFNWIRRMSPDSKPEDASLYASPLMFRMLKQWPPNVQGRLIEVEGTGTGFMMCSRKLIETLWRESVSYEHPDVDGPQEHRLVFENAWTPPEEGEKFGHWWGEDFAFCKRIRDIGFKVWVDMFIRLEHVGPMVFVSRSPAELLMQLQEQKR